MTLTGRVVAGGAPASSVGVQVQQAAYPRTNRFGALATAVTDADGGFSFTVSPTVNSRYRVAGVVNGAQLFSPVRTVYAFAKPEGLASSSSGLRVTLRFRARASASRQLTGRLASFYYREKKSSVPRATLAGTSSFTPTGPQLALATLTFTVPRAGRYDYYACLHTIPGLGRPQPACGRSSLPKTAFH